MAGFIRKQLEGKDKDELIDILSLQSLVETLVDKVSTLEKEVPRLKKPSTSRNSSLPPSKDLTSARYPKRRSGGGGKTGGQPGHTGHTLEMSPIPDVIRLRDSGNESRGETIIRKPQAEQCGPGNPVPIHL